MAVTVAYSVQEQLEDALWEIQEHIQQTQSPAMLVYFASAKFSPEEISRGMQELFPDIPVFGCTSAGEIVSAKMLKGSVVAMLLDKEVVDDVKIELIDAQDVERAIPAAFKSFEDYYRVPMADMDYLQYVGMILIDGLSCAEERIMEKIGDLTNVTFIGGSAGDDLNFEKSYIYANGRVYANAALLALIKPSTGFDVIKTQSFCPLTQTLHATKVEESTRDVLEFDGKSAATAYADALGVPVKQLGEVFPMHPLGLMVGDEPYVRSPQKVLPNQGIRFYCHIKENMELQLLEATHIIEDTARALKEKRIESGTIAGLINFHCILRTLELEEKGLTAEYGQLFAEIPTIGFSTYGEEYIGHVNQTSTMLVFR